MPVRIRLLDFLAGEDIEGKRTRFKLLNDLERDLSIGKKEGKLVGFTEERDPESGRMYSDFKDLRKDPMKAVEVNDVFLEIICNKLKSLEDTGKLKKFLVELYDVFYPEIVKLNDPDIQSQKKKNRAKRKRKKQVNNN